MTIFAKANLFASDIWHKTQRTKPSAPSNDLMSTQLRRCLTTTDIILLGIGHMVGSGAYVLTSSVARNIAGPAIILSYIISGFAAFLCALCYAEFSSRFPKCGSAYSCNIERFQNLPNHNFCFTIDRHVHCIGRIMGFHRRLEYGTISLQQ